MSEGSPRWIILQTTLCDGTIPYFAPDDTKVNYSSFLFFSPRDAKRELLEHYSDLVAIHLEKLDEWDDDDFPDFDGWIEQVDYYPEDHFIAGESFEWKPADVYGFFGMEVPK